MPWIEALLRGQKILARVKADGDFEADGGRVEIRYKPNDGRAYRAGVANLTRAPGATILPDETCAPGEPVAPKEKVSASASGAAKKASAAAAVPVPSKDDWVAYTDGACSGNPGPAGSGVVIIVPGGKVYEGYDYLGTGTNNVAELTAILRALEAFPADAQSIVVHTDSQYAIGVLQKGWKAKANQELIRGIKVALGARPKVRLVYVPGHAGVPMNERADELAREAIRVRKSRAVEI